MGTPRSFPDPWAHQSNLLPVSRACDSQGWEACFSQQYLTALAYMQVVQLLVRRFIGGDGRAAGK